MMGEAFEMAIWSEHIVEASLNVLDNCKDEVALFASGCQNLNRHSLK